VSAWKKSLGIVILDERKTTMRLFKKKSILEALRMAGFTQGEAEQVARYSKISSLQDGDKLTEIGGYSSEVYLLVSGTVLVSKASGDSFELESSFNKPVVIGEISALRDRLFSVATVTATGPVTAIVFSASRLSNIMGASQRLSDVVLSQRAARLDDMARALKEQRLSQWAAYESYLEAISRSDR
jgi:CRP-like cAMP-binding protein